MDLNILRLTFSHFKKESICSIQFDGKIKMIFSDKVCINFHNKVFSVRYSLLPHNFFLNRLQISFA